MNTEYAADKLTDFFYQLLYLVNNEYAIFYDLIQQELKSIPTTLKFEHNSSPHLRPEISLNVSGITSFDAVDVYSFKSPPKKTNW